jgi:hypothetical protein
MATLRKATGSVHFKRAAGRHGAVIKKITGLLTIGFLAACWWTLLA